MPGPTPNPWARSSDDPVRDILERDWLAGVLARLLTLAPGGRVLDLGCGDGLVGRLAEGKIDRYLGVDLFPAPGVAALRRDLHEGLGPLAREPFDLYVASFGVASHLAPEALERLVAEIAAAAAPGAVVALEALGLHSLEWPGVWDAPAGPSRLLPYRLADEVTIHPWTPFELGAIAERAGLRPLCALDRSVQFGPKLGDGHYWPGLPPLRRVLAALLREDASAGPELGASMPPLPAHPAADVHHALAGRRRQLVARRAAAGPAELGRAAWALEPRTGLGIGHGVMLVARVN